MRPNKTLLTGLIAGLALAGSPRLQSEKVPPTGAGPAVDPEAAIARKASEAIADYESAKGDASKRRQAARLLKWLGEVDHESITRYLEERLEATAPGAGAAPYLQAIALVSRPELHNDVWSVLHDPKAPAAVRQSAATALLSMGGRSTDRLLKMLRKGKEAAKAPVLAATVQAIVLSKDESAIRGVVPLLEQGTSADKIKYLRMLETVRGIAAINTARARLVKRGSLLLGAIAWRQLAVEKDPRARDLAIDLLERMPEGPTTPVAAEMIVGIALVRDPDLYPLLLRYGSSRAKPIKLALRVAARYAKDDMALMRYMARRGLESDDPGARDAAILLLLEAPAEAVAPLIERVRKKLQRPRKDALDLATGLHELLARDPTWQNDLLKLARSSEPQVRTVGLSLLREMDSDAAIEIAQKSLGSKHWELRAAAIRYLTSFRVVSSIPLLIARFDKEEGRLATEIANALFVHTGTRCFKKSEWRAWWSKSKVGFALPHPDSVKAGLGGLAGQTSAYFGIPLVSKRVAFLIDVSGSMGARIQAVGTDRKRRRIDGAKRELTKALTAMPEEHHVNVIAYNQAVRAQWKELREATEDNREQIVATVKKLRIGGGTNIYGALERAFMDPNVDTIYLLTDGEPSAGEVVLPDDIADEVRRWNRLRQIVIHTIGFGIDSALLKRLAEESGGIYTYVK